MFRIQLKKDRELSKYKSQSAFAEALGVSQSTVGNWEAGTREPSISMILKIANLLNVSVDELLCNEMATSLKPKLICGESGYWDGSRLSEERNSRGYSIEQLAKQLEMTAEEYTALESGSCEPTFETLLQLADVFSSDLDYICHRTMKLNIPSRQYSGNEYLLIKKYRALDERGQSAVWNILNHEYISQSGEKANAAPKEA